MGPHAKPLLQAELCKQDCTLALVPLPQLVTHTSEQQRTRGDVPVGSIPAPYAGGKGSQESWRGLSIKQRATVQEFTAFAFLQSIPASYQPLTAEISGEVSKYLPGSVCVFAGQREVEQSPKGQPGGEDKPSSCAGSGTCHLPWKQPPAPDEFRTSGTVTRKP